MRSSISILASLAPISVVVVIDAAHDADKLTPPTCTSLGIPITVGCTAYCGELGYDGETDATMIGAPGSSFWSFGGYGDSCKCKTSPPGTPFNELNYVTVCHNPGVDEEEEVIDNGMGEDANGAIIDIPSMKIVEDGEDVASEEEKKKEEGEEKEVVDVENRASVGSRNLMGVITVVASIAFAFGQ